MILGRNGAVILADRRGALHVLLTGRVEDRIARAAETAGISREQAARRLESEDSIRAEISQRSTTGTRAILRATTSSSAPAASTSRPRSRSSSRPAAADPTMSPSLSYEQGSEHVGGLGALVEIAPTTTAEVSGTVRLDRTGARRLTHAVGPTSPPPPGRRCPCRSGSARRCAHVCPLGSATRLRGVAGIRWLPASAEGSPPPVRGPGGLRRTSTTCRGVHWSCRAMDALRRSKSGDGATGSRGAWSLRRRRRRRALAAHGDGAVHLTVSDLDRSVAYYGGAVGLSLLGREDGSAARARGSASSWCSWRSPERGPPPATPGCTTSRCSCRRAPTSLAGSPTRRAIACRSPASPTTSSARRST